MTDADAVPDRLAAALADRYRIERELGQGGMATVYLAQDLKHDRKVALKVLKPELAAVVGGERFLAEIRTTANLQHPHILPLYDSGQVDQLLFYVMPYVEGESLRDTIDREKQLPVDQAVELARKVAEALDYAHEQGVVHRDIKPANILLSERGEPLVADFGIALAVSQAGAGRVTETGLSMGTPHYMSPEQATGDRDVDPRSDVYGLGCVLFEMLVGQPPFAAPSAQAVLARILTDDPDPVTKHRHTVPPHVEAVIQTALERLPADRFPTARAFAQALTNPVFRGTGAYAAASAKAGEGPWRTRFVGAAVLAGIALVAAVVLALRTPPEPPLPEPVRFSQDVDFPLARGQIAVSPDGRRIAFGNLIDFRARFREMNEVTLETWDGNSVAPRFVPGRNAFVAYTSPETLEVISREGAPRVVFPDVAQVTGHAPGDDGFLYLGVAPTAPVSHILRRPLTGGVADTLLSDSTVSNLRQLVPQVVLPGSRWLLYSTLTLTGDADGNGLHALNLETGESRLLFYVDAQFGDVQWMEDGYILFADGPALFARRFDTDSGELQGEARTVARVEAGDALFGYGGGILVLAGSGGGLTDLRLSLLDLEGRERDLPPLPEGSFLEPAVSPDGRWIAVTHRPPGQPANIWSLALPDGPLTRISLEGGERAQWSPDGRRVYFVREGDLWARVRDGTAPAELVLDLPQQITRVSPTASGDTLYLQVAGGGGWDLVRHVFGEDPATTPLLADVFAEGHPAISPDGRWLAYYSGESGRIEIYARSLGPDPRRIQISRQGGAFPRWSSDGESVYFYETLDLSAGQPRSPSLKRAALQLDGPDPRTLRIDSLFPVTDQTYSVFPGDSLIVVARSPAAQAEAGGGAVQVTTNFPTVVRRIMEGSENR